MTKEEILSSITGYTIDELNELITSPILQPIDVLEAMDTYGRQCFKAARSKRPSNKTNTTILGLRYYENEYSYNFYEDYENEN